MSVGITNVKSPDPFVGFREIKPGRLFSVKARPEGVWLRTEDGATGLTAKNWELDYTTPVFGHVSDLEMEDSAFFQECRLRDNTLITIRN